MIKSCVAYTRIRAVHVRIGTVAWRTWGQLATLVVVLHELNVTRYDALDLILRGFKIKQNKHLNIELNQRCSFLGGPVAISPNLTSKKIFYYKFRLQILFIGIGTTIVV